MRLPGLGHASDLSLNNEARTGASVDRSVSGQVWLNSIESGERLLHAAFHGHGACARDFLDAEALQKADEGKDFLLVTSCFKS